MVYHWLQKIKFGLFPATCLLCGAAGEGQRDLCANCRQELPVNTHPCLRCAMPLAADAGLICGQCQRQAPVYDSAHAPLLYQAPVDFMVKELKFHGRLAFATLLGEWLAGSLAERGHTLPQAIVPVPLHLSRLRERGFNQALELARPVARRLGVRLLIDDVRRVRPTTPQTQLDAATRRDNVRGAFIVHRPIPSRHVAILDDVISTGSTVSELAGVLRAAGVEKIEVWACARALGHI